MQRIAIQPRQNWQAKCEALGFDWHTTEGNPYWDETAYWQFSPADIEHLRQSTADAWGMMLDAIEFVITNRQLPLFGYSPEVAALIEKSWEESDDEPTLYGRFDWGFDGSQAKLLEFNGDNPGTLFETSMVQKAWAQEVFPGAAQHNFIHERLVAMFRNISAFNSTRLRNGGDFNSTVHITCMTPSAEGEGTAGYLQKCAQEGGVYTQFIGLPDIGWKEDDYEDGGYFVDLQGNEISYLIKLAPLGWMLQDDYGPNFVNLAMDNDLRFIEPAWKMLASNKRLLATMWDRNAYHPILLETGMSPSATMITNGYAKKPVNGLEGQNITLFGPGENAVIDQTQGSFANDQFIYQEKADLATVDDNFAVLGTWVVGGNCVALGVREATTAITDSSARFVPHIIG